MSLLDKPSPFSAKEAEEMYPQWHPPGQLDKAKKKSDPRKLGRGQGDRRIPTERRRPANPRMGKKDSAAQLVFDALSFVLSDRF